MQIGQRIFDFTRPVIMGILNVTPDSFSDGGEYFSRDAATARAMRMIEEGAEIIDIGGESSRPGSEPVSADEELRRVLPVIVGMRQNDACHSRSLISIDTTKAVVAREAVLAGADMINDISAGAFDPGMFEIAAACGVPICLMHMRGTPKTMQAGEIRYDDVAGEISAYLNGRAEAAIAAGISRDNIMIDPGIGFGKTVEHNVTILKELRRLKNLDYPIVIGTSRKSFIGKILAEGGGGEGKKADIKLDRLEGSLATLAVAYRNGANIFRVHDVLQTRRFLTVLHSLG